ncbi:MAG: hypothetical protein IJU41_04115, partial [Clostridia bacterium]|nr:hypothetical protein [Clostridia bacterium]
GGLRRRLLHRRSDLFFDIRVPLSSRFFHLADSIAYSVEKDKRENQGGKKRKALQPNAATCTPHPCFAARDVCAAKPTFPQGGRPFFTKKKERL